MAENLCGRDETRTYYFCFHQVTVNWAKLKLNQSPTNSSPMRERWSSFVLIDDILVMWPWLSYLGGRIVEILPPWSLFVLVVPLIVGRVSLPLSRQRYSIQFCSAALTESSLPTCGALFGGHGGSWQATDGNARGTETLSQVSTVNTKTCSHADNEVQIASPACDRYNQSHLTSASEAKKKIKNLSIAFSSSTVPFTHLFILLSQSIVLLLRQLSPRLAASLTRTVKQPGARVGLAGGPLLLLMS